MSAIAGIYCKANTPVTSEEASLLMRGLERFPADDVQGWREGSVFLGCHAQWITPESIGESNPFHDPEAGLVITADAIIDNRNELLDQLGIAGRFRTEIPDSRLILLAYTKWGTDCAKHLIGEFAFVIWDGRKHQLFGARDLLGGRTLYYCDLPDQLLFCTVIEPLLLSKKQPASINEAWLSQYLAIPEMIESIDVHATVYNGINQLPPAHCFVIKDAGIQVTRYDTIEPGETLRLSSNEEYVEAFREVFREAVNSKLRTFKAAGVTLSGGLDSGATAGFAVKELRAAGKQLHTYSYVPPQGFTHWAERRRISDETPYINETIRYLGNVKPQFLDFEGRSPLTEIDSWLHVLEMPYKYFENSFWIKAIYEQAQQDRIGVMLVGAKGNYTISYGAALDYYASLLKKLRWLRLNQELKQYGKVMGVGRRRLLPVISKHALADRSSSMDWLERLSGWIHPEFAERSGVFEKLEEHRSSFIRMTRNERKARDTLFRNEAYANLDGTKATKLSLMTGVMERDPTADPRVVRFCMSLPAEQYVQQGMDRAMVRRASEGYLPDSVRLNQKNRGLQGSDWMFRMEKQWPAVMAEVEQLANQPFIAQYVDGDKLKRTARKYARYPGVTMTFNDEIRGLMRSLIVCRFIEQVQHRHLKGGETYEKNMVSAKP